MTVPGLARAASRGAASLASRLRGTEGAARRIAASLPTVFAIFAAGTAFAHTGQGDVGSGFVAGFLHPITGLDHMLAMLAVGMWGAQLGMPAIWVLPVAFPMVMAVGGALGIVGLPLPATEPAIVASVLLLGAAITSGRKPPVPVAAALVAFFAIFHGYAHGRELPAAASAIGFSAGFVLATGCIHLTGIGIGFVTKLPHGESWLRGGGAAITMAGVVLAWRLAGV